MPRLVVGMPAFNAEKTVRQAVLSTLRSMPRDSQLLVFDDCSTDRTLAVLDTVKDQRLRLISSAVNVGGGAARNRMIEVTDSEYFAAMDADDITLPWRFRLQLRALESADVTFSSAVRFGESVGLSSPIPLDANEMPAALLFHCPAWHPSLTARRSVFERVGRYVERQVIGGVLVDDAEDYQLWLRMALSRVRMCRIGTPTLAYRQSPMQVTRSDAFAAIKRIPNRGLQEAYLNLYNCLVISTPLSPRSELISETVEANLGQLLGRFRLVNRAYYSRLLESRRARPWLSSRRLFPSEAIPN